MDEMNKTMLKIMLYVVGVFICLSFTYLSIASLFPSNCCSCGVAENYCCPCINEQYIPEVSVWYGHSPSSAGSWEYMCREYKEEHNLTFECFE